MESYKDTLIETIAEERMYRRETAQLEPMPGFMRDLKNKIY